MRSTLIRMFAASLVAIAAVGCSGTGSAGPTIEGAWARPGAAGADSAAYFTITAAAGQPDALLSASSPDATTIDLHESTTDAAGMMGMHPIDRLDIKAGATVELKPGGYHMMVMGLTRELAVGGTIELDLVFEHAGRIVVQAEIRQG